MDHSDEFNCEKFLIDPGYIKTSPPPVAVVRAGQVPKQNANNKLKLHTKIVIYNVLELDEVRSVMILKLKLTVYWTDTELKYFDLKPNGDMNTLTPSEIEQIWIPTLLFTDTKYSQFVDFKNNTAVVQIDINKSKKWANTKIKQMFYKGYIFIHLFFI